MFGISEQFPRREEHMALRALARCERDLEIARAMVDAVTERLSSEVNLTAGDWQNYAEALRNWVEAWGAYADASGRWEVALCSSASPDARFTSAIA